MSAPGRQPPHQAPPVQWFHPAVLLRTGIQAGLSAIFERFADKREQQAGIDSPVVDLTARDELWIDYVSDLGDGFDATASVAHLLASPSLELAPRGGGEAVATERGALLVMGGDQVYPFASEQAYEQRTIAPYEAMLPYTPPPDHPLLLAIPGNHDWYDGLTSFMRVFAQPRGEDGFGRWIGGWRTVQRRSYFAVRLPHRWWLWGIDIQLDTYIDSPQIEYFTGIGRQVQRGDGVILCCARPGWLSAGPKSPEAYSVLDFFERTVIRPTGARLRLSLTGDHHSYARYADASGEQKVMAGGGGAYLAATHHFPPALELPPRESRDPGKTPCRRFELAGPGGGAPDSRYPPAGSSREARRRAACVLWRNGPWFPVLFAIYYALGAALAQPDGWAGAIVGAVFALLSVGAFAAFTKEPRPRWFAFGIGHAALHLAAIAALAAAPWPVVVAGAAGAVVGPLLMAVYLVVADKWEVNTNELFAGQRVERYKCFVRLHIEPGGDVVVHAVGVDDVCDSWVAGGTDRNLPSLRPATPIAATLIDGPVRVARAAVQATVDAT